jgi:hypothetical protein
MESSHFSARLGNTSPINPKSRSCGLSGCPERAILTLDFRSLCLEHFVSHCYSRLQECEQGDSLERLEVGTAVPTPPAGFLDECRSKIVTLLLVHGEFTNLDRARLLDILLWASELMETGRTRSGRGLTAGM